MIEVASVSDFLDEEPTEADRAPFAEEEITRPIPFETLAETSEKWRAAIRAADPRCDDEDEVN